MRVAPRSERLPSSNDKQSKGHKKE
jgi:hypothetical protein